MSRSCADVAKKDGGSVMVLVLVVSVLLMGVLVATLNTSDFSGTASTRYGNTSQASLAAQSGLAVELNAMRSVGTYTSLPCGSFSGSLSAPGATSSYSGTITYYPTGSTTAMTCSGSTLGGSTVPATGTIMSTGAAPHGLSTTMEETVTIAASSTPAAALGYAIFSASTTSFPHGTINVKSYNGNTANIYSQGSFTCTSSDTFQGTITTYQPVSLTGSCVLGGLVSADGVSFPSGSATVNGNVTDYGGGGCTQPCFSMAGGSKINGNGTETNGNMSISSTLTGNAAASGTITVSGTVGGTRTPNDSALSSLTMPPAVSFPILNPSDATWLAQGWAVIDVASSSCASYFKSLGSGSDPWQTAISTETSKTVYDASSCAVSFTNAMTFSMKADTILEVKSISTSSTATFTSTTTTHHDFSILAGSGGLATNPTCPQSTTMMSFTRQPTFASSITFFLYSPGVISYSNDATADAGQILACGGFNSANSFLMNFDPSASAEIPGSTVAGAPTVTVTNKYVS